jgi:hypothetical protein
LFFAWRYVALLGFLIANALSVHLLAWWCTHWGTSAMCMSSWLVSRVGTPWPLQLSLPQWSRLVLLGARAPGLESQGTLLCSGSWGEGERKPRQPWTPVKSSCTWHSFLNVYIIRQASERKAR